MTEATHASVDADRELLLERVFDAPPSLVYKAWTDPAHLPYWYGPKGFTITTKSMDFRTGGSWDFFMHGPDGKDWPNFHRYLEIVENQRLVVDVGESADGPAHFRQTVTFTAVGDKTRVQMHSLFPSKEACEAVKGFGAVELGYQTLDKLGERLKVMGLSITRSFDAPRALVYKAWTEAERLAQWWGPTGFDLEVVKHDLRPGGVFLYRMSNNQGHEMWGKFVYLEASAPERLVYISSFSNPEGETVRAPFSQDFPLEVYNVLTFSEHDGKTTVNLAGGPHNASEAEWAFYDNMNASMNQGFEGTFKQLDAYLVKAV